MSPAYSPDPRDKFCWVGIIMYTPSSQSDTEREDIRKAFVKYCKALDPLLQKYNAQLHWAKIESPLSCASEDGGKASGAETTPEQLQALQKMRERIRVKYSVDEFNAVRKALDPKGILANSLVETFLN
jgi:L-galactono-1,4-lactone dehydrogenase